ncbi:MAG: hypothetical protein KGJ09_06675 [Candidatus Omnitrophica bacterium]|nr:hypothetical protein [Candidatus Omnitrophota bacterium]MDE2009748.1 hypothetical protein [Candidatus Omnitrophota bacterium]
MPLKAHHLSRKPLKTCCMCGRKKVFSNWSIYCRDCLKTTRRMHRKRFPAKAQQGVREYIRAQYYRDYYIKVALELDDETSPWYLDFDHWRPGDPIKIVICAAIVNDMKQDMTQKEFRYYVIALDDHRRKHLKVKKRHLKHWYRLPKLLHGQRCCAGCGRQPTANRWHKYCPQCSTIAKRMVMERFPLKARKAIWDYIRKYGYICYYTGMELDLFDEHSPWYLTFDHWTPANPKRLVITSRMVNAMKQDLTEKEFWYLIHQFADHFRYGTRVRKCKLKYWLRPYGPSHFPHKKRGHKAPKGICASFS